MGGDICCGELVDASATHHARDNRTRKSKYESKWASKETTRTLDGSPADFKFHVHPGNTSKEILEDEKTLVNTSRDAERNFCTPDTTPDRVIFMSMANEIPADAPNPSA